MSTSATSVLKRARSITFKPFSATYGPLHNGQVLEAYCAAFVRWCFSATGKPLPVEAHPEFYRHLGLSFVGVENTADGFSGRGIGDVVGKGMRAGDILLFRNTYGNYQYGTITHVGIASDQAGMMYDAGSGSIVHHRSIEGTFPKKLVEVRRPRILGGDPGNSLDAASGLPHRVQENATRVQLKNGHVSAKLQGKPVRDLNVVLYQDGRGAVEGHWISAAVVSLIIHDASGKVYKMHRHHNKNFATDGVERFWISVTNGGLEVSITDGKSERVRSSRTGQLDRVFTALKPTSLELTILH